MEAGELPAFERPARPWDAREAALREFRPRRTLAASCVAGALVVTGVLTVIGLVRIYLDGPGPGGAAARGGRPGGSAGTGLVDGAPGAGTAGTGLAWHDPAVLGLCAGLVATGLLLLLLALVPGRSRTIPLVTDDPDCVSGLSRRGLRCIVAAAASGVPGIEWVRVRLRGRAPATLLVWVGTDDREPGRFTEQVERAVRARIESIGLAGTPRVLVRLRWKDV